MTPETRVEVVDEIILETPVGSCRFLVRAEP
jgi:hypothetical protein